MSKRHYSYSVTLTTNRLQSPVGSDGDRGGEVLFSHRNPTPTSPRLRGGRGRVPFSPLSFIVTNSSVI